MLTESQVRRLYRRFDARRIPFRVVSLGEALDLLRGLPAQDLVILARTEAREVRKECPIKGLTIAKRRVVQVNVPYEEEVNRRRVRERKRPDFEEAGRRWGFRVGLPFVEHVDKNQQWHLYLSLHIASESGAEYLDDRLRPVPLEEVEPYIRRRKAKTRQGLRKEVVYRDYEVSNILAFVLPTPNGRREQGYIIDHGRPAPIGKAAGTRVGRGRK